MKNRSSEGPAYFAARFTPKLSATHIRGIFLQMSLKIATTAMMTKDELLHAVRTLYETHGIEALLTPFLEKKGLYAKLLAVGLRQPVLLAALGLAKEYAAWRQSSRKYRGVVKPTWTWDLAVQKAAELKEKFVELPTLEWLRRNGHTSLANAVYRSGHSFEELRVAVGSFATSRFRESRSGIRWLSQPEASLSDFLYARGIPHKRGERYETGYAEQSGRRFGRYDMHFLDKNGGWIDVEVWGDLPESISKGGRYSLTRKAKEAWHGDSAGFLGIQFRNCLSDERLTRILEPYIGVIEPFQFDKPQDRQIETAHWTDADELLDTCRALAAQMPDGIFPGESWLRKRGKHADRPGETYNSVAIRVNQWLGGTRNVRRLLGHGGASTIAWTPESAIKAWQDFQAEHGLSPTQMFSSKRINSIPPEVRKRAQAIRQAAVRHGVLDEARNGKTAHKIIWTEETVVAAWREFETKYGLPPSKFVGTKRRQKSSKDIGNEAARIYNAARKFGLLAAIRDNGAGPLTVLQKNPHDSE